MARLVNTPKQIPSVVSPPVSVEQEVNQGTFQIDVSSYFVGSDLTYTLESLDEEEGIFDQNGTGVFTLDSDIIGVGDVTLVVTAENPGGTTSAQFTLSMTSTTGGSDPNAPVINLVNLGDQSATTIPVEMIITEETAYPVDIFGVGVPTGESDPSPSQIIAGQKQDSTAAPISMTFSVPYSADSQLKTVSVVDPSDATYDFHFVARDADGNVSGDAGEDGIPVVGGFVESSVVFDGNDYLTFAGSLPTLQRSMLGFYSVTRTAEPERTAVMSWNGIAQAIYMAVNPVAGQYGLSIDILDSQGANINTETDDVSLGDRCHVLFSIWVTDTTLNALAYIWDETSNAWNVRINASVSTLPGATLLISDDPLRLYARSDSNSHKFVGNHARMALWTSATGAPIADISDSAVRDLFTSGINLVGPSVSRNAIGGTLQFDISQNATALAAGSYTGNTAQLGTMTLTGALTDD